MVFLDNALLLGGWGSALGPHGIAVYAALALRADNHTQQAWPSYDTLTEMTGISRNKVIEVVRELEAWNIVGVQHRKVRKGNTSNLFTLLHRDLWRQSAEFRNAKGQIVCKSISKDDLGPEVEASFSRDHPSSPGGALGAAPSALGAAPDTLAGSQSAPEVVRQERQGGTRSEPEQDSSSYSEEPESDLDGVCLPSLARGYFGARILRILLKWVAPGFQGPEGYLKGLSPDKLDRLGTLAFRLLHRSDEARSLTNPAGYLRWKLKDANTEDDPDDMEIYCDWWRQFCILTNHIVEDSDEDWPIFIGLLLDWGAKFHFSEPFYECLFDALP